MKIILTLSQLKKLLETEDTKYPITFEVANFSDEELKEFSKLLQQKERAK
jgi:succinate dehydrogenase flavin-adding protein (antitoxin of CptAB toxin-antitoxin module)